MLPAWTLCLPVGTYFISLTLSYIIASRLVVVYSLSSYEISRFCCYIRLCHSWGRHCIGTTILFSMQYYEDVVNIYFIYCCIGKWWLHLLERYLAAHVQGNYQGDYHIITWYYIYMYMIHDILELLMVFLALLVMLQTWEAPPPDMYILMLVPKW
jgi:hypothetical protein